MVRVELSSPRSDKTDERVLRVLLGCLRSSGKSCHGMGKRRIADVLVNQNPRIRVGASLAYLTFDPLHEDEDGELKLFVRGVAYEPECGALRERLPALEGAPPQVCDGDYAFVATPLLLRARQYLSP